MNIAAGTYTQSSTLYSASDRHFSGAGSGSTTVEGANDQNVFHIYENTTIEAMTVKRSGSTNAISGILVYGTGADIKNNLLFNSSGDYGYAVYFDGSQSGNSAGGRVTSCEVKDFLLF